MELTINHIAPYLPYSLKVLRPDGKTILDVYGVQGIDGALIIHKENDSLTYSGLHGCKPLLLPLSELALTSPVIIKGSEIDTQVTPAEYISTSIKDSQRNIRLLLNGEADGLEQWKFERLLQLHFDVFNLIPEKLAIDLTTIVK